MQAIIPQNLSILNDSVPEDEAPAWDEGAAYEEGDSVTDAHYLYLALTESQGKKPGGHCDMEGAPWRTISVTNKYACLDLYRCTQTVAPQGQSELVIQVPFTRPATAVGLLNLGASALRVTLQDSTGETVWDSGEKSLLRDSGSWWDYYFGPFRQESDVVLTAIPPVSGVLTVTLTGPRPAVGSVIVGERVLLGQTQYGARSGFIDYSVSGTDAFGNEVWVKRRNARRGTFPVFLDPKDLDHAQKRLAELSGNPALWIGDDGTGFQSLIIFGFLKEYEAGLDTWGRATATFDVRGIV